MRVRVDAIAPAALIYADLFGATPRVRADGATELALSGVRVVLEQGAPEGARGVGMRGLRETSGALEAYGVRSERA